MGKFKFGSSDHLDAVDEHNGVQKANSIDRSIVLKKITDKQKSTVIKTIETDEKMAEDLMAQFIKILKERNELKAQIEVKNTDLLNISQDLVTMTM